MGVLLPQGRLDACLSSPRRSFASRSTFVTMGTLATLAAKHATATSR
jgi:hypothetical protein